MGQRKGQTGNPNGRKPGSQNKATIEFKEAVNNLISFATPQMVDWLTKVAKDDPNKALDHVYKFAQFGYPLQSRSDTTLSSPNGGPVELSATVKFLD